MSEPFILILSIVIALDASSLIRVYRLHKHKNQFKKEKKKVIVIEDDREIY